MIEELVTIGDVDLHFYLGRVDDPVKPLFPIVGDDGTIVVFLPQGEDIHPWVICLKHHPAALT